MRIAGNGHYALKLLAFFNGLTFRGVVLYKSIYSLTPKSKIIELLSKLQEMWTFKRLKDLIYRIFFFSYWRLVMQIGDPIYFNNPFHKSTLFNIFCSNFLVNFSPTIAHFHYKINDDILPWHLYVFLIYACCFVYSKAQLPNTVSFIT